MENQFLITKSVEERTAELFRSDLQRLQIRTDRMFAWLLGLQWLAGIAFALLVSPTTWAGSDSEPHPHLWFAIFFGGAIAAYPIALAIYKPGTAQTRHTIAVAQMLASALLIHLTGGRVETHFHVFGSLAFLSFYRDWRVLVSASAVVALDHFFRGLYYPMSVYGVAAGAEWRWVEHAAWVLFEDTFLILACTSSLKEMKSTSERQALLESANEAVTEATDALRHRTDVLNSILASMGDGVIVADMKGDVIQLNPAAEEILGQGILDVPVSDWSSAYHVYTSEGLPYPAHELPLALALRGVSSQLEEMLIKRTEEDEVWIEATGRPLLDDQRTACGGVVVFRDVTERKRIIKQAQKAQAEAEKANLAKSEFLSRMSHELRTPLNSILGFSQVLQMQNLDSAQQTSCDHIYKAGKHLLNLINEVLEISRIESGNFTVSQEPVALKDLLEESVQLMRPLADARKITIIALLDDNPHVLADKQRLMQVMINLLSNAVKYNRPGGQIQIWFTAEDQWLKVHVKDTGLGVPEDKWSRLFLPFDRLDAESDSTAEGTGLGLALSKALVVAMNGDLRIEESSEEGSTFSVTLEHVEPTKLPLEQLGQSAFERDSNGEKVLLYIEDNPANLQLVEKLFSLVPGYKLLVAVQGRLGLELAHTHRPDIILLDVHLPDCSGDWVLTQIRESEVLEHIPVIILSADATEVRKAKLLKVGANAYLTKPLEVSELLSVLQGCEGERRVA